MALDEIGDHGDGLLRNNESDLMQDTKKLSIWL